VTIVGDFCLDYYDGDYCKLDKDDAGLTWDAVSFTFLLIMSRVYKTWYFQHVRTDLEINSELAARYVLYYTD